MTFDVGFDSHMFDVELVEDKLVVDDTEGTSQYVEDIKFCPMCGRKL